MEAESSVEEETEEEEGKRDGKALIKVEEDMELQKRRKRRKTGSTEEMVRVLHILLAFLNTGIHHIG